MYNLYIAEKKRDQYNQLLKQSINNQKQKDITNALSNKYQLRIKNFVIDMLSAKAKVIVTDFKEPIKNCREDYLEESNKKIKGRAGFLFGGFKCERDRIKETIERNKFLYNSSGRNSEIDNRKSRNHTKTGTDQSPKLKIFDENNKGSFNKQPALRFKPRTDLERIKEEISKNSFQSTDYNQIIQRQLTQLDLNVFHAKANYKNEDGMGELNDDYYCSKEDYIVRPEKNTSEKKEIRQIKYKKPINIDAKQIMPEFHFKTHFKGAESVSIATKINREMSQRKNNVKPFSTFDDSNGISLSSRHVSLQKRSGNNCRSLMDYTKNQNPNRVGKENEIGFKEKIEQLKEIIHRGSSSLPNILKTRDNEQEENKYGREDEIIHIGNKSYSIKTQFDIITRKMLQKCNVYHHKNKNNNSFVKSRQGKLMITNGMTVQEFEAKYNFSLIH